MKKIGMFFSVFLLFFIVGCTNKSNIDISHLSLSYSTMQDGFPSYFKFTTTQDIDNLEINYQLYTTDSEETDQNFIVVGNVRKGRVYYLLIESMPEGKGYSEFPKIKIISATGKVAE